MRTRWTSAIATPWLSVPAGLLVAIALSDAQGMVGLAGLTLAVVSWSRAYDRSDAFLRTWIVFGSAHLVAFPWVVRHPALGPAVAGALAVVLIPMLIAAAWALLWEACSGARWGWKAVGLGCGTAVFEWILHAGPMAMPWGLPGHALSTWTALDGPVSYLGSFAVTALVLGCAVTVAEAVRPRLPVRRRVARSAVTAVLVSGMALFPSPGPKSSIPAARVALIQPGMDPETWDRSGDRLGRLESITDSLLAANPARPDWIQWPETALRSEIETKLARESVRRRAIPLVSGTLVDNGDGTVSNAVLVLHPDGRTERYDKRRLVPLVEATPFADLASRRSTERTIYRAGSHARVASIGRVRVGFAICFETLFPSHTREMESMGSDLVVAVTNDGWWRDPDAAESHLAFSRRRSVETGLPLVQASVGGFTGAVHPDGSVHRAAAWMERRGAIIDVPFKRPDRTVPFTGPAIVALLAFALFDGRRRKPRSASEVNGTP